MWHESWNHLTPTKQLRVPATRIVWDPLLTGGSTVTYVAAGGGGGGGGGGGLLVASVNSI